MTTNNTISVYNSPIITSTKQQIIKKPKFFFIVKINSFHPLTPERHDVGF